MAAYRQVDDLWSPAGWLPIHRDQVWAQRSVSNMGKHLPFYIRAAVIGRPSYFLLLHVV